MIAVYQGDCKYGEFFVGPVYMFYESLTESGPIGVFWADVSRNIFGIGRSLPTIRVHGSYSLPSMQCADL